MKIAFIDTTNYSLNYGLRSLASYVAGAGHDVRIIFMPTGAIDNSYDYPRSVYNDLDSIISDTDMVGFSFVSNYIGQARRVTRHIKKNFDIPVAWGGIHPTADPEGSLEYADMVCLGEGEEPLAAMLGKMEKDIDILDNENFWFKKDGSLVKNASTFFAKDLDKYPYPLYEEAREFIIEDGKIVPMSEGKRKTAFFASGEYFGLDGNENYQYMTLTSRGCPHHCTYCCNNLFLKLYGGRTAQVRHRSVGHVIGELKEARDKFPFVNFISIFDDDFCSASAAYINEFSDTYKKEIGLPFKCNVSPNSVTEEKIDALVGAGLISVEMGLQSASPRVNKDIYKRNVPSGRFAEAAKILNKFNRIIPYYDVMYDNPFESRQDMAMTARFLMRLPKPYNISAFSLTFFPGTELSRTAKEKGAYSNERSEIYDKKNNKLYPEKDPYIKFLYSASRHINEKNRVQSFIFNIASSAAVIFLFNRRFFLYLYMGMRKIFGAIKGIKR